VSKHPEPLCQARFAEDLHRSVSSLCRSDHPGQTCIDQLGPADKSRRALEGLAGPVVGRAVFTPPSDRGQRRICRSTALPAARARPLSRYPAIPLSRYPAIPLSRYPAIPLSRYPAIKRGTVFGRLRKYLPGPSR